MLGPTKVAVSFVLVALSLMMEGTTTNAESKLPDLINADVAEKLFRLDCGRSLANDESVWTPGENVGRSIEFSSTCWLIKHGSEWLLWDTGVPEAALNDPRVLDRVDSDTDESRFGAGAQTFLFCGGETSRRQLVHRTLRAQALISDAWIRR